MEKITQSVLFAKVKKQQLVIPNRPSHVDQNDRLMFPQNIVQWLELAEKVLLTNHMR